MKWFFLLICSVCLLSCNDSNNSSLTENEVISSPQVPKEKTLPKKFMAFTNNSIYDSVITYLTNQKIPFIENPDLSSFEYYKRNHFPNSTFLILDCPAAKFLWIPQLYLESLSFKGVLLCFNKNILSLIVFTEANLEKDQNIAKLRNYYIRKYGDAEYFFGIDTSYKESQVYKNEHWKYNNLEDTISIQFHRYTTKNYPNEYASPDLFNDELAISFSRLRNLNTECDSLRSQVNKAKDEQQKEADKKVFDNL